MKTILILRHAKSGEKHSGMADHDRPLNERGESDAPLVGERIRKENLLPDWIISSTAKRAVDTARRVATACGWGREIDVRRSLYMASPADYIGVLKDLDDDWSRPLIVGHNPGLEEVVAVLTGRDERLPTSALVRIELPIDSWADLTAHTPGRLVAVWR